MNNITFQDLWGENPSSIHASGTKPSPVPVAQSVKEKEAIAALALDQLPNGWWLRVYSTGDVTN